MTGSALPPVGARVDAVLADGHAVAGEVLSVAVGAIFFRTEDRIETGTELRLQWPDKGAAREAAVCVYPSARKNVVFAKVRESEVLERRAVPRIKPAVTLMVRVEPILRPDGMRDPGLNGTIVDISTMAVAFVSERRLPDNTAVTVGFRSRRGRTIGSDVPGKIIRFEHRHPRFLVVVQFEADNRQKGTIDEVLAACRAGGEGEPPPT